MEIEDFIALPTLLFTSIHLAFHGDHRPAFHGDFWRVTAPRRWSSVVCAHGAECWWNLSGRCEDFDAAMVAIVADRKTPKKWTKGSIYEDFRRIFFYVFWWRAISGPKDKLLKTAKASWFPSFSVPHGNLSKSSSANQGFFFRKSRRKPLVWDWDPQDGVVGITLQGQ